MQHQKKLKKYFCEALNNAVVVRITITISPLDLRLAPSHVWHGKNSHVGDDGVLG